MIGLQDTLIFNFVHKRRAQHSRCQMKVADLEQCALIDHAAGQRLCIYNGLVSADWHMTESLAIVRECWT